MALIQELNREGKTIVFVTHEPDIAAFSGRTLTLRDGRILKDTINQQVRSAKDMLAVMPETEDY
jgi:putative ABC transport system ATP-binding protein